METQKHCLKSFKKTDKGYYEVHGWLDERIDKNGKRTGGRFTDTHTKEGLAYIQEKYGEEAYWEAVQHLIDDGLME